MPKQVSGGNTLLAPRLVLEKVGLKEKMTVADLGCGSSGYFTLVAAEMVGKRGKVYAVDILKTALQGVIGRAKMSGVHNIIPVWSNLEVPNGAKVIKNNSLDVALLINILFQSKNHEAILKETARMTKQRGKVLIVDWESTGAPFGPTIEDRPDKENLKRLAQQQGLKFVEEFAAGQYHFGLIFKKY